MTTETTSPDNVINAVDTVKKLVAAGLLTPELLGFSGAGRAEVPGERITVAELVAKARPGLTKNTKRTYNSYMKRVC